MKAMKKYLLSVVMLLLFTCTFMGIKAKAATVAPSQVTGVKQTTASESAFDIEWNYVNETDCYYEVWIATSADGTYELYDYTTSNSEYINQRNSGTTYYVKVRAYTREWDSTQSAYINTYGEYSAPVKAITAPGNAPASFKQTAATTTSITLKWKAVSGATGYVIAYYPYGDNTHVKSVDVKGTTKKISGLSKNTKYMFTIYPYRKDGGNAAISNEYADLYYVPTLPTKVSGLKVSEYYHYTEEIQIKWGAKDSADGYCYELYYGKKKVKTGYTTSNYASVPAKIKKFYKVRVKAYSIVNGKKKFGAPSAWIYISQQPEVTSLVWSGKTLNAKWQKVSGATGYTVYISDKANGNYKKVGITKKTKFAIKKYGKKTLTANKTYYVKVVANKKVGSKTYKSNNTGYWYLY